MKILKSGLVLFIITAVAAFSLANVEKITRPLIAEQERIATNKALKAVMEDASSFEKIEGLNFDNTLVSNVFEGVGVGYVIEVNPRPIIT